LATRDRVPTASDIERSLGHPVRTGFDRLASPLDPLRTHPQTNSEHARPASTRLAHRSFVIAPGPNRIQQRTWISSKAASSRWSGDAALDEVLGDDALGEPEEDAADAVPDAAQDAAE
jgi:hypothetical protein